MACVGKIALQSSPLEHPHLFRKPGSHKRGLDEEGIGGSLLQHAEQFNRRRACQGRRVNADQPSASLFETLHLCNAGPQQALGSPAWTDSS